MRDKAGIISNEPEGVGVGEKVPKDACTSGVFFGYFRRLPFWGGVDEVPVKFKDGIKGVLFQVVKYIFFGVGHERPRRIGVGDFVLVFGHGESLLYQLYDGF
nr:MAG TPA: hypothetical protein [Bacteriophage sp.]